MICLDQSCSIDIEVTCAILIFLVATLTQKETGEINMINIMFNLVYLEYNFDI